MCKKKSGAIIVKDNRILSTGIQWCSLQVFLIVIVRDVIEVLIISFRSMFDLCVLQLNRIRYPAPKTGEDLRGATLYVNTPLFTCAKI